MNIKHLLDMNILEEKNKSELEIKIKETIVLSVLSYTFISSWAELSDFTILFSTSDLFLGKLGSLPWPTVAEPSQSINQLF